MPQIDLMQSDLPHTLYRNIKNGKKADGTPTRSAIEEAERLTLEARKRKAERLKQAEEDRQYTLNEIFNGEADNE